MDYRKYLTEDVLKFWLDHGIDPVGGIMTQVDINGNITDKRKSVMFTGRALWTYAMAYRLLGQKEEYRRACERLCRHYRVCELSDGTLPDLTDRDGNALTYQNGYTHSEMHAASGLAQFYRISGHPTIKQKAERYFDIADQWYRECGPRKRGASKRTKSFGLNMLVLSTAQFVRNAGIRTEACDTLIKLAVDEMMTGGYVEEENHQILEIVTAEGERASDMSCPGHIYEAAWFVMCEGEVQNNDQIRNFGRKLCDYAMPENFMEHCLFIPTSRDVVKQPYGDPMEDYAWWPQCEAIITYRLAYNIFGDKKYLKMADRMEKAAFDAFADQENGEWYTAVSGCGVLTDASKGSLIKGPFHLPRMLLALMCLQETGSIYQYME